ncbi:hypothetical protein H4R34_003324 [Dimargaris verticillata]|uniref:Cytochrome P450 n=1 Tax=Dimargaris verticillata TaxID=2761393 RepID=A0A9W8B4T1_9FUNG|nr:hypothetical protein H4R34_003324 [Dimargaris verticillata]
MACAPESNCGDQRGVLGPFLCKIIPALYHPSALDGTMYLQVREWHTKYGPVVRIGHKAVTVAERKDLKTIYMSYDFPKAPAWYHAFVLVEDSIFSTPSAEIHRQRRRIYQPAFTRKALRQMEPPIIEYGPKSLIRSICRAYRDTNTPGSLTTEAKKDGVVVDFVSSFILMTLDIITDLGFGKCLHSLDKGYHPNLKWFQSFGLLVAVYTYFPFLRSWLKVGFREQRRQMGDLEAYVDQCVVDRKKRLVQELAALKCANGHDSAISDATDNDENYDDEAVDVENMADKARLVNGNGTTAASPTMPDILGNLILSTDPVTNEQLSHSALMSEALTVLFAGSETTASALTASLYLMIKHTTVFERLQREILAAYPLDETLQARIRQGERIPITADLFDRMQFRYDDIQARIPYMEAVITECLRFLPSAPGVAMRIVPEGGRAFGDYFLPDGTEIGMSIGSYHHGSEWDHEAEFNPERFMHQNRDKNTRKLLAFSMGQRQCPGRLLAYMEMVLALTPLFRFFHLEAAAPSELNKQFLNYITIKPHDKQLLIRVRPRVEFTVTDRWA